MSYDSTRAACPNCRCAHSLMEYPYDNGADGFLYVVECSDCLVIAPAEIWDELPRRPATEPEQSGGAAPPSLATSRGAPSGRCPGNGGRDVCVHPCSEECAVNGEALGPTDGWPQWRQGGAA